MTTYTWKRVSGTWDTAADWTPTGPPNADTADALIDRTGFYSVIIGGGKAFTANQVTLDAAHATLRLVSGGSLTLAGTDAALILNAGTFNLAGLLQGGTVEAGGATVLLGGTLDGVTWLGPLTFGAGEGLTVVGGLTVKTAAGTSPGIIDMSAGGDTLSLTSGETLDNAILNFSGSGDYLVDATSGGTLTLGSGFTLDSSGTNNWFFNEERNLSITSTLINAGLLNVSGGTFTDAFADIVNNGTITLGGGTLEFDGQEPANITNSGSITIGAGSVLDLSRFPDTLINSGSVTIGEGGELSVYQITANTGPITVGSGGLLSVGQALDSGLVALDNGGTFLVANWFSSSQPFIDNGLLEAEHFFSANGITIASGGTLIGPSNVSGKVTDSGLVEANGGVMELHNAVTGTGVLQIDAGAALQLDSSDSTKVDFAAVGGTLILEQARLSGTIDGFTIGDRIELPKVAFDPSGTATMLAGNTLQVVENTSTYDLKLDPAQSFAGGYFHLTPDDGTGIIENTVPPYFTWTTAISGDWGTGADWTPAGPPDAATANAVIDAIGSYTVTISSGESFVANALTLAAAGATLSAAGTLTLNVIINDGLIDIVGGTVDSSQGTLNNAGVISIGSNGTRDGELMLNAIATNGGSISIAAGGTLDLLGARTLSGDTVAGLGSVTSTGGLLLVSGLLDLGGGTLDVAATGPLSEFEVAGQLANGTVDANAGAILLENGAILNGVTWQGTLTIFASESVAGVAGGNGINVVDGSLTNYGTITGGSGSGSAAGGAGVEITSATLTNGGTIAGGSGGSSSGGNGGSGGVGVAAASSTMTSDGTIAGGNGGNGNRFASGGGGGAGVSLGAGCILTNDGGITGGSGGYVSGYGGHFFAGSGAGVVASSSVLTNNGTILGGSNGSYGYGGSGVDATNSVVTNNGTITAGYGGFFSTGRGVDVASSTLINAGTIAGVIGVHAIDSLLTNDGTITGVGYFFGAGGTGVDATNSFLTNNGTILGGTANYSPSGGDGVLFHGGGTLTDGGLISGGNGTSATADAVEFGSGASRLILQPGASFSGAVVADAAFSNVLELASAASAGIITGLGDSIIGFTHITVDANAAWTLAGSDTVASGATLTVLDGASLTDGGALENDGAIALDPSTLTVGSLIGTGRVTIGAGSTLEAQATVSSGETIRFAGNKGYLHFDTPGGVAGDVTNFGLGETIDLKGVDPASVTFQGGQLGFTGGSFSLALAGAHPVTATASDDGAAVALLLCFCADTLIQTPMGERRVQDLAIGDDVTTLSGAKRRIVWIGTGTVPATRGQRTAATPVIVRKGALADNIPNRDLRLTKGHALYLEGALIPVEYLVNHRTIEWDDCTQEVELYHIELATHDVLIANGAPAESYRDDGNRWLFDNAGSGAGAVPKEPFAAVLTGGPLVDRVWRQLLERGGKRLGVPLTQDADLHLEIDGRRVDAASSHGQAVVFALTGSRREVRVVSRAASPDVLGVARDPRLLGVALRQIVLRQGARFQTIKARDARLAKGFHRFEAENGWRWTDGDAVMPGAMLERLVGPMELVLHVGCTSSYPIGADTRPVA
jgi:hypothetical protein